MMDKPSADRDQQELEAAIKRLTEATGNADSRQQVYYRNPLEVAREEWRKRMDKVIHTGSRPEVVANQPTAHVLAIPAPVPPADIVDMAVFNEAKANWQPTQK